MAIKDLIEEIRTDVNDVFQTGFEYVNTNLVPNRSDGQLTFERNVIKRGKILTSCVLYVDIRNSVNLTRKHHSQTMGRIYTAFSKAVLKAAKHHNGHIRNIIGDRVMVVFPAADCFTNAVDCAISINHIAKYLINTTFKDVDFQCGIGIDFGELKVIKVGVQRKSKEGVENRSLVWVGYPANIASRLTDMANKTVEEPYFEVVRNPRNPRSIIDITGVPGFFGSSIYDPKAPMYLTTNETIEMSIEQFANSISSYKDGELYMSGGNFIRFSKKRRDIKYPGILMTESVFNGFKKANPTRKSITLGYLKEQPHKIKNVTVKVFGGDINWEV